MTRRYFYPRSPCGERRFPVSAHRFDGGISIHALLAESDVWSTEACAPDGDFYPRSPCGERPEVPEDQYTALSISIHALLAESDPLVIKNRTAFSVFLSTLSLRRATIRQSTASRINGNFYPRSPCGERPHPIGVLVRVVEISIHALLAESDFFYTARHT